MHVVALKLNLLSSMHTPKFSFILTTCQITAAGYEKTDIIFFTAEENVENGVLSDCLQQFSRWL